MKQYRAIKFVTACLMTAVLTFGAMCLGTLTGRNAFGTPIAASAENNNGTDAEVYLPDIDEYRDVVNKISLSAAAEHTPAGEPEWEWNNNIAEAHFVCADCGKKYCVEQIVPETKYKVINNHSEKDRYTLQRYYEAEITLGGREYTDTFTDTENTDDTLVLKSINKDNISVIANYEGARVDWYFGVLHLNLKEFGYDKPLKYGVCAYIGGRWKMLAEGYNSSYDIMDLNPNTIYKIAIIYKIEGVWIKDFSNALQFHILPPESLRYPTFDKAPVCYNVRQYGKVKKTLIQCKAVNVFNADMTMPRYDNIGIFVKKAGKWTLVQELGWFWEKYGTSFHTSEILRTGSKFEIAICAKRNDEWDLSNIEKRSYTVKVREIDEKDRIKIMSEYAFSQTY